MGASHTPTTLMNNPEPLDPNPEISPKYPNPQPVTSEDVRQMRADIAAMDDKLTRILEVVVDAPARLEAARKAKEAENARQMAEAVASGKLGHFSA